MTNEEFKREAIRLSIENVVQEKGGPFGAVEKDRQIIARGANSVANTKEDAKAINFDDQFIYEEIARPISERKLFTQQLLRNEAIEAFQKWSGSNDKVEY